MAGSDPEPAEASPFESDAEADLELTEGWGGEVLIKPPEIPFSEKEVVAPSLETIVASLTPSNRELLDELFRAKFIGVRKVDPEALR